MAARTSWKVSRVKLNEEVDAVANGADKLRQLLAESRSVALMHLHRQLMRAIAYQLRARADEIIEQLDGLEP